MNNAEIHVLLLEDNPTDILLMREALAESATIRFRLSAIHKLTDLPAFLKQETCDVILLDLGLPDSYGMETLTKVKELASEIPLVVVTGLDDEETGLQALNNGAQDYLVKGQIAPTLLARSIRYAIERNRLRREINQNEQLYRNAIEVANAVPYYQNYLTGSYDYVGEGIELLTGYSPSEFDVELFRLIQLECVCQGHLKGLSVPEAIMRAKKENIDWQADFRIKTRSGEERWLANAAVQVRDEAGNTIGSLGILQDITERKEAESQLSEVNKFLERKVRERTQSLLHYQEQLQIMAAKLTLTEQNERRRIATELHDYLAQILVVCKMKLGQLRNPNKTNPVEKVQELEQLLDQSLKYTRTLIAELSPAILYELGLKAAIGWLADQMKQHNLAVKVEVDCEEYSLPDDQGILLFQAIRELLFNVVKHAHVSEATVNFRNIDGTLTIVVADKGKGFDLSVQENNPTGIGRYGLFSIRERLEAIGGRLEILSAPQLGTQVTLFIPIKIKKKRKTSHSQSAHKHAHSVHHDKNHSDSDPILRILIADDHEMVRKGIRSILESDAAFEVIGEAANGEEAIRYSQILQPDVVLMDINMPCINGIEATRQIKQDFPNISVIGLSVHDDKEMEWSLRNAGATAYFTKGGPFEDLARTLHSIKRPHVKG